MGEALAHNSGLMSLTLSICSRSAPIGENTVGLEGTEALAESLQKGCALRTLQLCIIPREITELANAGIDAACAGMIASALSQRHSIIDLDLSIMRSR